MSAAVAATAPSSFPVEDLVPTKETNSWQFVNDNPDYDGSGVIVGILDTGVDPGAYALQTCKDGRPKLIDMIDCSGSGDVDVSFQTSACLAEDGSCWEVQGLQNNRVLRLNPKWKLCPFPNDGNEKDTANGKGDTNETVEKQVERTTRPVRLGLKRAYELFPATLVARLKNHRKKTLQQQLDQYIVDVRNQLAAWNEKYKGKCEAKQIRARDDLQARLQVLQDSEWEDDPGPLYECVVFYDGTDFRAAIDVHEDGNLITANAMTDFRKERQYATFGVVDQYNYAVNIYDDGNVLSIVCDVGAHATHVAGIATACEEPSRNGVAPGAQIISFKIGDSRMGSMETGTSLTRALMEAVKRRCDVINLSYGEGCVIPNRGRFVSLAEDLVWKHNILFVASAGNNGPAISTVGAPGGTSSAILGVSAYVSPAMMKAAYSMSESAKSTTEELLGTSFTWSSVGPTADGDNGVNVMAPGEAITSVSNWTLQKSMLMNGTSMSSPHATGCVALLLSACKKAGVPISPSRVYRAIENTSKPMNGLSTLQQGWGMIQVDKAWEYLLANKDYDEDDVHFHVHIEDRNGNPRGVYLRQQSEASVRQTFSVRINPTFRRDDVSSETQRRRIDFEMKFNLKATESWVNAPEHFMLMHNGRTFKIEVDPTQLPPGVHTAKVLAYNSERPDAGVVFSVPITVAKPLPEQPHIALGELKFQPAEVKRFFVSVPKGSTWMDVTIRDCRDPLGEDSSPRLINLHTVHLLPHAAFRDAEMKKNFQLLPSQVTVTSIRVHAGVTCEVALARYWSTIGNTTLQATITFRGVKPLPDAVQLVSGGGGAVIRVFSDLGDESISPTAKLTKWKTPLRPKSDGIVTPLGDRDVEPVTGKRIYQLVLTYEFTLEAACSFIPRAPALQGVLYESAYEAQIMMIFDSEKKYLGVADAWPKEVKAPKGPITIRLQVRHSEPEMLEKLSDMAIWIERKLEKDISLSAFATREDMMIGKSTMNKRTLKRGECAAVFFADPPTSKIPSACKPGDILFGIAQYAFTEASLPGDGKRPGGFNVSYVMGQKPNSKAVEASTPEIPDARTIEEKIAEAVRDLKVAQLETLTAKEKEDGKFEEIYATIEHEYPGHIPLLMVRLKNADTDKGREDSASTIVDAADKVIEQISETELALHFGKNHDKEDPDSCKERIAMEKKKGYLMEALARKARAFSAMKTADGPSGFESTLKELQKWVDIDSNKQYAVLTIERERRAGRHGSVLKLLNTLLKNNGDDTKGGLCPMTRSDILARRAEVLDELNYKALVDHDRKWRLISSPKSYALF